MIYCPSSHQTSGGDSVESKIVGGKSQKIKVNGFLLAFLETVGNCCRNAMIIDLLKVLYIAYESIRFNELLDKFYMLEAEICSKVTPALRDFS